MGKHKPSRITRNRIDKQKRHARRKVRKKLSKGLRADPRTGYKGVGR